MPTASRAPCSARIDETNRRREIQRQYNEEHGITPRTIVKSIEELMLSTRVADARLEKTRAVDRVAEPRASYADEVNLEEWARILEQEMRDASAAMDFERAATLRDQLLEVRARLGSGAGSSGGSAT
jgi:excinuclease ABC subunit B